METPTFAFVRAVKLNRTQLGSMSRHARGLDKANEERRRPDAEERAITHDPYTTHDGKKRPGYKANVGSERLNVSKKFDGYITDADVTLRKGAAVCMHLIIGVSLSWVTADGEDLHSRKNKRNQRLLKAANDWVATELGGVFAARMDLDEDGGAVVDVFAAPVSPNARSGKKTVSVQKALNALADREGVPRVRSFVALQNSWARYAQEHLDKSIQRGTPKEETGRDHLSTPAFKELKEAEKKLAKERKEIEKLAQQTQEALTSREEELRAREEAAAELEESAQAQKRENDEIARDLEAREEVVKKSILSWRKYSKKSPPWLKPPNNPIRLRDQANEGPGFNFGLFAIAKLVWEFLKYVGSMIVGEPHRILESVEYDNLVLVNEGLTVKVNEMRSTARAPKTADLPEKRRKTLPKPKNVRTNRPVTRPKAVPRPNTPPKSEAQETPVLAPENAPATEITNREHEPWFSVIEEDYGDLATSYRESTHYPPHGTMDEVDREWRKWLKDTAQQPLRGADEQTRELVSKAKSAAKALKIYETRRERKERNSGSGIDL